MTEKKRMAYLRSLTETNLEDDILELYLDMAADTILSRAFPFAPHDESTLLPERYHRLQCEVAAYMINKRGAEGEVSHSENGIVRTYESAAIPESMLRQIVPSCGVPR